MGELEIQLLKTLLEMVRTGGQYAIAALITWFIFQLLKIGAIGGFICLALRLISRLTETLSRLHYNSKETRISLIGKECSQRLLDSISEFQTQTSQVMTKLEKSVVDLKTQLKTPQKKTSKSS